MLQEAPAVKADRSAVRQTAKVYGGPSRDRPSVADVSASSAAAKILLTDDEGAVVLGVSPRMFAKLMHEEWFPRPVILGPRLKRHVRSELEAAVANMPRQAAPAKEPTQLQQGRTARQYRMGKAA